MVNQIKEQAEIIKSIYNNNAKEVTENKFGRESVDVAPKVTSCDDTRAVGTTDANTAEPSRSFYFDSNGEDQKGVKQPGVNDNSAFTWVQVQEKSEPDSAGYLDFYIRSCWLVSGGTEREENSTVILRLNK